MNLSLLPKAAGCFPQLCKEGEKLLENAQHSEQTCLHPNPSPNLTTLDKVHLNGAQLPGQIIMHYFITPRRDFMTRNV